MFLNYLLSFFFLAQGAYYGSPPPPHFLAPSPTNQIRVQIEIYDDPKLGGVRIRDISFNGQDIALQSADLKGFRGEAGFQLAPGTYNLVWTVTRDQIIWPRTIRHREKIAIGKKDEWVQITVQGEQVTIL